MTLTSSRTTLRVALVFAAALLAIGVGGCGLTNRKTLTKVTQDELSNGAEPYFNVGPVTYQVQESRQLNPFLTDDVQYFAGVPSAQQLGSQDLWLGVFLWAKNQTSQPQTTVDQFKLVDSAGTVYSATPLNPSVNPFAWSAQTLSQNGTEPAPDSTAAAGPTGGSLILFKVSQTIYENRPLTLEIFRSGAATPSSTVSLDL